jgi:hypothetical protein
MILRTTSSLFVLAATKRFIGKGNELNETSVRRWCETKSVSFSIRPKALLKRIRGLQHGTMMSEPPTCHRSPQTSSLLSQCDA